MATALVHGVADRDRDAFTIRETACRLNVGVETVRGWIRTGRLRAVKVNRIVRIPKSSVEALLSTAE